MKKENSMLMFEARQSLSGKWSGAVVLTLVFCLISGASSVIPFGPLLLNGPLAMGLAYYFLSLSRGKSPVLEDLFKGFNYFLNTFVAFLLVTLFTMLWTFLLIIPGIIAAISYSQVFFILAEDPTISGSVAIEKSKKMMYGYKWKYFCLAFRFIGWAILCVFTFGIGFFWLIPYVQVTLAKFHDDIKGDVKEVKVVDINPVITEDKVS